MALNKPLLLRIANPLLGLVLLFQAATGVTLGIVPSEALIEAHALGGYLLVGLAVIHVFLNWGWVKATYLPRKRPTGA